MSSTTQEYYIRKADEADARGPFTMEQLSSLAENGQVDGDTYYYDAAAESWTLVSSNPELMATLFPAKKSLRVKAKSASQVSTLNTVSENDISISVNDMLLAAEGKTEDTKDKADPAIAHARAATIGLYSALGILVITAAAYILPGIDLVLALDFGGLFRAPLPLLGVLNLVLALCLGLGAIGAYPVVRFAAMLGLGFTGTVFFFDGQTLPLACAAVAGAGLYLATICINTAAVLLVGIGGLAGAAGVAHYLFTR